MSNDTSITVESCFAHLPHGEIAGAARIQVPVGESRLMQLLGESITSARASEDGTLSLEFTNGHTLACFDDSPLYEAYRVRFGAEEIIV